MGYWQLQKTHKLSMFHKAIELTFKKDTVLEVTFQSGEVIRYDVAVLFKRYPFMERLKNRKFFLSGKLEGNYGIVWNDEIDLSVEEVYQCGRIIDIKKMPAAELLGAEINEVRNSLGITQVMLAASTGIDQSDISKIERGTANPSLSTLERIAEGLGATLQIRYVTAPGDYSENMRRIGHVAEKTEYQ